MKSIKLKELTLTNYRNIKNATYHFNGDSLIVGENRIGKTNTLEAICWLLTDYLLGGNTDIAKIKPLDDTRQIVSVEGVFDVDDLEVKIKKEYKEKWVRTRGSTDIEFQGHETIYYWNDVKQPTYKKFIAELNNTLGTKLETGTSIDVKKLLVDPYYLGEMGETINWRDLRAFIVELVGDVSDEDVINTEPALLPIKDELKKDNGRVDQTKKHILQTITQVKEQLIGDDAIILDLEKVEKPSDTEIAIAEKAIEEHESTITELRSGSGADVASQNIKNKLTDVKMKIAEKLQELALSKKESAEEKRLHELEKEIDQLNAKITQRTQDRLESLTLRDKAEIKVDKAHSNYSAYMEKRKEFIDSLRKIDADLANADNVITKECPYCHKPYDEEKINEETEAYKNALQYKKEETLKKGKANKEFIENWKADEETAKAEFDKFDKEVEEIDEAIKVLKKEKDEIMAEAIEIKKAIEAKQADAKPETSPEIEALRQEEEKLNADLKESRDAYANGIANTTAQIIEEQRAEEPFKKTLADLEHYNRTQGRLQEKREERAKHERALAENEQKKELLHQFIKVKLKMLDNNVARVFGNIKFQLIQENINGGYDAVCKPYIYDAEKDESTAVIWKSGSKSEKVVTGIAIAEAIKKARSLPDLPFLFDEGGEISTDTFAKRIKTNAQIICVKVQSGIDNPFVVSL